MAQILVKTPVTSNGRDVVIDAEGKIVYKETILEASAKPVIEKKNLKLPPALRKIITNLSQSGEPAAAVKTSKNVKAK